jgi:hypothetical protein
MVAFTMVPEYAVGKPFCSLRDPTQQIFKVFPHATNYKSVVHNIDNQAKKELLNQHDFTIHSKEIGRHTVFFALQNETPLGLIHVRTESGIWGLTEIVWALDMDLNIIDFNFQRCRGSSCKSVENEEFKAKLKGQSLEGVFGLLKNSSENLYKNSAEVPSQIKEPLAQAILRSAVKTIVITEKIWREDIAELKLNNYSEK